MKSWESTCQVCGKIKNHFEIRELKSIYRIFPDLVDVCDKCGNKLDSYVDYYGKKKLKDKAKVRAILINGIAVNQRFSALMNAGYI